MRLIQLTDFYSKKNIEFVDADDIARIETFEKEYMNEETYEETTGFGPFSKTVTKKRYSDQHTRSGSRIFMKSGKCNRTCVLETPEQIVALIKESK